MRRLILGMKRSSQLWHSRVRLCGHLLRKDDSEWVEKCMDFVVEGVRRKENMEGSS